MERSRHSVVTTLVQHVRVRDVHILTPSPDGLSSWSDTVLKVLLYSGRSTYAAHEVEPLSPKPELI